MQRRTLLKKSAGVISVGGMAAFAGCLNPLKPEGMLTSSHVEIETSEAETVAEVSGEVWEAPDSEGTLVDKVEIRVDLVDQGSVIASRTKQFHLRGGDGEHTVSFIITDKQVTSPEAEVTVLATWHEGTKYENSEAAGGAEF